MKLLVILSALVACGYSAPREAASKSPLAADKDISLLDSLGIFDLNNLPDDYNNSTHDVKVVNGSRIEVNQTVSKNEDEGSFFAQILITVTSSGKDEVVGDDALKTTPEGSSEKSISSTGGNSNAHQTAAEYAVSPKGPSKGQTDETFTTFTKATNSQDAPLPVPAVVRNDITYVGDTDVNYIGPQPRDNPDAEVFDVNLVREDAERFFAERRQPMMSQPIRSQPMMSQPIRSQPMMSQPIRSQPMMSQPIRSQPMMSQPMISQPILSQSMRWQSMRSQPMRSQSIRSQPIRSQSLRSQPMRSQPMRSRVAYRV